jgi:hypothetical protein
MANPQETIGKVVIKFLEYLRSRTLVRMFFDLFFIVTVCITISMTFIVFTKADAIFKIDSPTQTPKAGLPNQEEIVKNQKVDGLLRGILHLSNGSRATVLRYHNGLSNPKTGIQYFFMSARHEVSNPGVSSSMMEMQNIPVNISEDIQKIMAGECIYKQDVTPSTPLGYQLTQTGVKSFAACPLYDINGVIWGFVNLQWVGQPNPKDSQPIIEMLKERNKVLSGII